MEGISNRVERIEPIGIRGHERYFMQRYYGSPIFIIVCQQHSMKKERVYRTAKDPYRGNQLDIRL